MDGVFSMNEIVDLALRLETKCLIFKVDFEKAYDLLNCGFHIICFVGLGFNNRLCPCFLR